MSIAVRLPKLGKTMKDGTVVSLLVTEGDEVKKGDVIFEVETDKATLEIESADDGFVKRVLVRENEKIAVNSTMAVLGPENEDVCEKLVKELELEKAELTKALESGFVDPEAGAAVKSSHLLDSLKDKSGSGSIGEYSITPGTTIEVSRLQRLVGRRMLQSKREIPCFYLTAKADVTDVCGLEEEMNAGGGAEVSIDDFVVAAMAKGLKKYPVMTGQLEGDKIFLAEQIGVSLAMDVEDGAVAVVIKNVDAKTVKEIAEARGDLGAKASEKKLTLDDLEGGCMTLSNLGAFGVETFIPIVIPGQCSILGVGRVNDECVPVGGEVAIRKSVKMTISVDHRIANGADAAQFLDFIKKMLESVDNFR